MVPAVLIGLCCWLGTASGGTGRVVISADGGSVGDLEMNLASATDVRKEEGAPDHVWRQGLSGVLKGQGLPNKQIFARRMIVYGYGCKAPVAVHGCTTLYAFQGGVAPDGTSLVALRTRSARFVTAAGSHVGMALATRSQ